MVYAQISTRVENFKENLNSALFSLHKPPGYHLHNKYSNHYKPPSRVSSSLSNYKKSSSFLMPQFTTKINYPGDLWGRASVFIGELPFKLAEIRVQGEYVVTWKYWLLQKDLQLWGSDPRRPIFLLVNELSQCSTWSLF